MDSDEYYYCLFKILVPVTIDMRKRICSHGSIKQAICLV